jgi:hypothetical protein
VEGIMDLAFIGKDEEVTFTKRELEKFIMEVVTSKLKVENTSDYDYDHGICLSWDGFEKEDYSGKITDEFSETFWD